MAGWSGFHFARAIFRSCPIQCRAPFAAVSLRMWATPGIEVSRRRDFRKYGMSVLSAGGLSGDGGRADRGAQLPVPRRRHGGRTAHGGTLYPNGR